MDIILELELYLFLILFIGSTHCDMKIMWSSDMLGL